MASFWPPPSACYIHHHLPLPKLSLKFRLEYRRHQQCSQHLAEFVQKGNFDAIADQQCLSQTARQTAKECEYLKTNSKSRVSKKQVGQTKM